MGLGGYELMKKKCLHRKVETNVTEYDYSFHWPRGIKCPYAMGERIESPVTDGYGTLHSFVPQLGYIVRMDSGSDGATIYVETFDPIAI